MAKLTEIRWHGRGGQGAVTAGKMLADLALDSGQYFQAFPDYGPERAGAPIQAFTRLSREPIDIHSQIEEPDVVVVLDPTLIGSVNVAEGLKEEGILIANTEEPPAEIRERLGFKRGKVFTVNATRIAMDILGREITNTPMMGAFARATGLFPVESIIEDVRRSFGKKLRPEIVEANVAAIKRAHESVREG